MSSSSLCMYVHIYMGVNFLYKFNIYYFDVEHANIIQKGRKKLGDVLDSMAEWMKISSSNFSSKAKHIAGFFRQYLQQRGNGRVFIKIHKLHYLIRVFVAYQPTHVSFLLCKIVPYIYFLKSHVHIIHITEDGY